MHEKGAIPLHTRCRSSLCHFFERLPQDFFSLKNVCTEVPQTEQVPFMACRPFFIVTSCGSFMVVFFLHLTQ